MNYTEIVEYLNTLNSSNYDTAVTRFEIAQAAYSRLNIDIDPSKVILVAGTNGKGSTCASLVALLEAAGKKVGLYTSPHLVSINERIKINFVDISDTEFVDCFMFVRSKCNGLQLTHFEYLTLMACYYFFCLRKVDYAVLEVGLGGTYDATNTVPHSTCVITKLGLDHEKQLGRTLLEIAKNKFGIINDPSNQTVVYLPFEDMKINKVLENLSPKQANNMIEYSYSVEDIGFDPVFILKTEYGEFRLSLKGKRAVENSALAITVFKNLGYNPALYLNSLSALNWPGRMTKKTICDKTVYLSGDHNPQGIKSLIDLLQFYTYDNVHFIVGIANDKDYDTMLRMLSDVRNSRLYLTETAFKPRPITDYGHWLDVYRHEKSWQDILYQISVGKNDIIVCTGSLYLIGDIMRSLK